MTLIFDVGYCIKKGCSSAKKNGGGWLLCLLMYICSFHKRALLMLLDPFMVVLAKSR